MSRRNLSVALSGAILAAAYLVVANVTFDGGLLPVRPLYEGFAPPQPYRWVRPPPEFAAANVPPEPADSVIPLAKDGSQAGNAGTDDGQVLVAFYAGSIKPKTGETQVRVRMTPLDPVSLGKAPDELTYDSNAYRIEATYVKSKTPAQFASSSCPEGQQPKTCMTVIMRYARGARAMYRRDAGKWTNLGATPAESSLQIFADSPVLGTFVAAAHIQAVAKKGTPVLTYVALALGAVALLAAGFAGGTKRGRSWLRASRKNTKRWLLGPPPPRKPGGPPGRR